MTYVTYWVVLRAGRPIYRTKSWVSFTVHHAAQVRYYPEITDWTTEHAWEAHEYVAL